SQLTRENVTNELATRFGEAGSQTAKNVVEVIDQCEMARYAPSAATQPEQLYELAADTINNIERLKPIKH
ncbi:MAG: hypothetical protein K2M57_06915, partial [Paramuribaculum sp.]|nr:hypothetical protein [Paramuribaculum sp.]